MHELSLAQGVVAAVSKVADRDDVRGVKTVSMRIGAQAGVVREAFELAWLIATPSTPVEGAELQVEWVPATIWCASCDKDQPIDEFFALACPVCESITPDMPRGKEFEVVWVDLDVEEASG